MFGIMFRRFVLGDGDIGVDRLSFFGYSQEEVLIFFFIVTGAPLMEVAVYAVFNLDMHVF